MVTLQENRKMTKAGDAAEEVSLPVESTGHRSAIFNDRASREPHRNDASLIGRYEKN